MLALVFTAILVVVFVCSIHATICHDKLRDEIQEAPYRGEGNDSIRIEKKDR